jgi:hypothetical protein
MTVEQHVAELGLEFPPEPLLPNGVRVSFEWGRLILEVFGENGRHARTAIGVAALPLNLPVVISAELVVTP